MQHIAGCRINDEFSTHKGDWKVWKEDVIRKVLREALSSIFALRPDLFAINKEVTLKECACVQCFCEDCCRVVGVISVDGQSCNIIEDKDDEQDNFSLDFLGKEPEGMKVARFPENAAYSALNDLYVDADFMLDLKEFGVLDDMNNPLMQWTIQLSAAVKLGKTVLSPTTAMRNFWSGFMLLAAAGYSPLGGMKDALSVIQNAKNRMGFLSGDLILNTQEAEQMNQRYVRLGIRRDGASSGELAGIFRDFHKADQAVKEQGLARKAFNNALAFYQFGDDFFKIIHFEKSYADLLDAGIPPLEAEQEAARRTRDTMPTYSMVPKALQQLGRFPLIGTFVSFPWEVMRTLKNSLDLIRPLS